MDLITALTDTFGPVQQPSLHNAELTNDYLATLARTMANRLPEVATGIAAATEYWMHRPETINDVQPIPYRAKMGITKFAGLASNRLNPDSGVEVIAAAQDAAHTSAAFAAELDRTAFRLGEQPHEHLAAAHLAAAAKHMTPASVRWANQLESLASGITRGPDWPALARVIDRCAQTTNDVPTLVQYATREPLPARLAARELRRRLSSTVHEHAGIQKDRPRRTGSHKKVGATTTILHPTISGGSRGSSPIR